jgi:hypothetical protein
MNRLFGDVTTFDVPGDDSSLYSKYLFSVLSDIKPEESPLLPAAAKLLDYRLKHHSSDLPTTQCLPGGVPFSETLPFPFKIIQNPGLTLILHESDSTTRQIYTDGRKHTPDPQPTWSGYSVGHWDGTAFVVVTVGFNDKGWLDASGTPHSEALHTVERMRRPDFGHLSVEVTFEDPKTFSRPFAIRYTARLLADSDIQENICGENEKDVRHFR